MTYRNWIREGEAELAAMPQPTPAEDQALSLELARENAEHSYGYGPLPGIGARDPEPADDAESDDAPRCEWCSEPLPDDEYAPYCSPECEHEATRETPSSIHPRPEEVG